MEVVLQPDSNSIKEILDNVGALVVALDSAGRIICFNRTCIALTGYSFDEVKNQFFWDLFLIPEERFTVKKFFQNFKASQQSNQYENSWRMKDGTRRWIAWSNQPIYNSNGEINGVICTGTDISDLKRAEIALRESENKYQSLYRSMLEGVVINELVYNEAGEPIDYRILDLNPKYEAILDLKREEVLGKCASEVYGSSDSPYLDIFAPVAITGVPAVFETYFEPMQKIFLISVFSIGSGKFAVVFEDITERKAQEEALRTSEQRLQKLAANIPGMIYQFLLHPDGSYSYPYVSAGCRELYEIEPGELQENASLLWEMIHPEDVKVIADAIARSAQTLQPWKCEGRIIPRSGRVKWIQGVSRPEKQENGDILWDGLFIDITESKLVEAALSESEARYRSLVDTSPNAVLVMDLDLNIFICNRQAEVLFRYDVGEIIGKNGLEFLDQKYLEVARKNTFLTLKDGSVKNIEYEMIKKDGTRFYAEVSASTIADNQGQPQAFMVVAQDINDRKMAEIALRQANEELERRVQERTAELKIEIIERQRAEEALRSSELRFRTMFEQFPLSIQILSPQGQTLQVNRAYEEMWNVKFEVLANYNMLKDKQLSDRGVMSYIQRGFAGETCEIPAIVYNPELTGEANRVSERWVRAFIYPVKDEVDNIREVILIHEDISDRVRAEEALKESEARMQAIIDNSPAVIYLKEADGKYLLVNRSFETIFRIRKEEIIGKTDREFFPKDIADAFELNDRTVIKIGNPLEFEEIVPTEEGERTYLSIKFPLYNAADVPYALCGISTDISDRKRSEAQLKESEERFRSLFEQAAVGMNVTGLNGQFLRVNQRFSEILGYDREEMRSLFFRDITHPDDLANDYEYINRLLSNEIQTFSREKRYISKDRRIVWANLSVSLVRDANGEPEYFMGVFTDISDRKALEKELALRQARFDAFFAAAPAGLVILDDQLRFAQINPTMAEMQGISVEAHIGHHLTEILPKLAPTLEPILQRILKTGEPNINVEISGESPQYPGMMRHWVISHFPLPGEDGKPIGIGSVAIEITESKRANAALRESEERYRTLAKNFPNGAIFLLNRELRYILAEGTELAAVGLSDRAWEGKTVWEMWPQEMAERLDYVHRVTLTGEETIVEQLFADRLYIVHLIPIKNESEEILGIMAIAQNITERKAMEKELAWREQLFNSFIQWAPLGLAIFDKQLHYLHLNETLAAENGLSVAAHLGRTVTEIQPHFAPGLDSISRRILMTGEPVLNIELSGETSRQPGVIRHWMASYFPIPDADGSSRGIGAVLMEISDRVRVEKALRESETREREKSQQIEKALRDLQQAQAQLIQTEKMSSLGQLVAGVAHEINNPVSFIYGNVDPAIDYIRDLLNLLHLYQQHYPAPIAEIQENIEAIELDFLVEDLPKLLSSMKVGAERIREIVLSLRNFSRLDESSMKPVDIHEGIDSTLMILQNRLKDTSEHREIQVIKEYGKLPLVECYAGQLNQVLMNLIANAIDALDESNKGRSLDKKKASSPAIAIRTAIAHPESENSSISNPQFIEIAISDNGPGMTEDVKMRLFDPFFTTKPVGKGTGLGLAISYQIIVEKHGGQLICNSAPGQGAEFVITIPIQQSHNS